MMETDDLKRRIQELKKQPRNSRNWHELKQCYTDLKRLGHKPPEIKPERDEYVA